MTALTAAAPAAKDSAPNNARAKASAPDKSGWSAEIHTPAGEYNANLPVADIVPDPLNRKTDFAEWNKPLAEALQQLADSIKADGLVQPIAVRPCPRIPSVIVYSRRAAGDDNKTVYRVFEVAWSDDMKGLLFESPIEREADRAAAIYRSGAGWQIIAGERRWRAHLLNGAKTIRAFLHRGETAASAAIKQTVENTQRLALNPIEEAKQMKRLADLQVPQKEIGKRFGGKSQPVVSQMLKLLEFPPEVQKLFAAKMLSPAHGEGLGRFLPWRKACVLIAEKAAFNGWDAKSLRGEIPCERDLQSAGLATLIYTGSYSYDTRKKYTMPGALSKQPGFFKSGYEEWCYLLPEDPKEPNLWEPERVKQDKAREEAEKREASKEAAGQSKLSPAERAKRQKVIADNKQARAESALAHVAVFEHIKGLKDLDGACLAVIAETAFAAHWKYGSSERIKSVATKLGIKMPSGSGLKVPRLGKIKPLDVLRLTAACICDRELEDCIAGAYPIAPGVEHVLGDKQTKALRAKAEKQLAEVAAAKAAKKGEK